MYRTPLKYFYDTGKINFPSKIGMEIRLKSRETEMKKIVRIQEKGYKYRWALRENSLLKSSIFTVQTNSPHEKFPPIPQNKASSRKRLF